jgi:hypothetical protein
VQPRQQRKELGYRILMRTCLYLNMFNLCNDSFLLGTAIGKAQFGRTLLSLVAMMVAVFAIAVCRVRLQETKRR